MTHDGRYLEPFPIYVDRAAGARKWDVDGNELVDYWMGHGALLLGHSHPAVVEAVRRQAGLATHPGACHELEIEWGEWIQRLVPSAEQIRFTNSGTEATLMALRVARIATGRTKVVKFIGHFHGWHDALLPAAEPPHDNGEYPTPGVTDGVAGDLVLVPPNDLAAVARAIDEHQPACVIHEGNGAHWGAVPAEPEFLRGLRKLTRDKKVLLILDEVITGFRVAPGGFQEICEIEPDLSTFAKVLAGGLPGGCLAGRADIMQVLAFNNPLRPKDEASRDVQRQSAVGGGRAVRPCRWWPTGEPCRVANEAGQALRQSLNELFERKSVNWVSYGRYSAVKILPEYDGPRPEQRRLHPLRQRLPQARSQVRPGSVARVSLCAALGRSRLDGLGRFDVVGPQADDLSERWVRFPRRSTCCAATDCSRDGIRRGEDCAADDV